MTKDELTREILIGRYAGNASVADFVLGSDEQKNRSESALARASSNYILKNYKLERK